MSIIDCERAVWSADYFVFCRSVSEKYVLYEFNTLKLLFSETQVPTTGGLLCVPSFVEAKCPASIEEIVLRFALTGTHASGSWSRMAKEGGRAGGVAERLTRCLMRGTAHRSALRCLDAF